MSLIKEVLKKSGQKPVSEVDEYSNDFKSIDESIHSQKSTPPDTTQSEQKPQFEAKPVLS